MRVFVAAATTEPPGILLLKCYCVWRTFLLFLLSAKGKLVESSSRGDWVADGAAEQLCQLLSRGVDGLCPRVLRLALSFQKSVCWLAAGAQPACELTPTAGSTPSRWTTSMRCWKSIPWCGELLKRWLSTGWTELVSSLKVSFPQLAALASWPHRWSFVPLLEL